jgi:hypothetical protein
VLDALLNHLNCVEQDVSQQLAASVVNTLHKQRFLQVIAVGCQLLCTLARLHAPAAAHVTQLASKVYNIAAGLLSIVQPTPGSAEYRTLQQGPRCVSRCLGSALHFRLYEAAQLLQAGKGAW